MNQRELFTLAVRIAGIVGMMYLIRHWAHYYHRKHTLLESHWLEFIFEILLFIIGIFMSMGFPVLMRFIFPPDKKNPANNPSNPKY